MVTAGRRSRLRPSFQDELIKYFVVGATARPSAALTGVNRHTATLVFHKLREIIAERTGAVAPELLSGEIEVDESYFGGVRKGKRGRGAAGKVPVFGLLKRGGKVHAVIIPNVRSDTFVPIIRDKIRPDSIFYSDSFTAYDMLDVSEYHNLRINHSDHFDDEARHIKGFENFWNPLPGRRLLANAARGRSAFCAASTASRDSTSRSISRNANGASITAPPTTS